MTLRAALDTAGSGRPNIVLLMGEAGIGKTRLADEAATMARADGMRLFRGEADAARREPLELWRGVCHALGVEIVSDAALPAEERRWELLETLSDALTSCAPALVVLEDLHWADAIAIWVLDHLPQALGDAPVALVVTSRDGEPDMPRLDALRRVSRLVQLEGLDVVAVGLLAGSETGVPVDAGALHARTGGNPLFVQELGRTADGGWVIADVLDRSFDRFDDKTRALLATAAVAGSATPLALLAIATDSTTAAVADRLDAARRAGVVDEVTPAGVRFHHALFAESAARLTDARTVHGRLAAAWSSVPGLESQAAAAAHRLRSLAGSAAIARAVEAACEVATELVAAGQPDRAAGLLRGAHTAGGECVDRPELRARVALDLAQVLCDVGDLDPALVHFGEAAELARDSGDPVLRARAEIGTNLWVAAILPDPARMHQMEEVLGLLPSEERHLRAMLLARLAWVGGADVDATERVREWAAEALEVARHTGDPVLIGQALAVKTMSPRTRSELDARISADDEIVHLGERAGRSELALDGHQRRFHYYLSHGDIGAASRSLARAELIAGLLPSPAWRQRMLVLRTTLFAVTGDRSAATAAMYEAARLGEGHIEPLILLGSELLAHQTLLELYGHVDPRGEEVFRIAATMTSDIPLPFFQVLRAFGAQMFGDEAMVNDVLPRVAADPDRVLRSLYGDHLLRNLGDTIARAGATQFSEPVYRTLLPFAGLLSVAGGECAGLPVDDVLGRLAMLQGDAIAAVRHAREAVALTRSMPAPPLLVHCLDHLADAIERTGVDDAQGVRAEADSLAAELDIERPGRTAARPAPSERGSSKPAAMRRDGILWTLTSPLGHARLPDSNGLRQLARLVTTSGVEVSALELSGRAGTPIASEPGPSLDAQAKRAYRQRLLELQGAIDDAEATNDPVRGERAHVEMDALLRELKRAVGLGGRDRPTGSDAERARVNVVRSLKRAIAAISDQAPLLAAHLEESVRTGHQCMYLPAPVSALAWTVEISDPS